MPPPTDLVGLDHAPQRRQMQLPLVAQWVQRSGHSGQGGRQVGAATAAQGQALRGREAWQGREAQFVGCLSAGCIQAANSPQHSCPI